MNTAARPERIWLALLAAALLALLAAGGLAVYDKHRWATDQLASIEPRYARLAGLQGSAAELEQLTRQLSDSMAQFAYPPDGNPANAGTAALQRVRELATAADLRVSSSQALAASEEEGFYRVGLNLYLEGEWSHMAQLLQNLSTLRPAVYVERLQITSQGGQLVGGPQRVDVSLGLFVLQERSASGEQP